MPQLLSILQVVALFFAYTPDAYIFASLHTRIVSADVFQFVDPVCTCGIYYADVTYADTALTTDRQIDALYTITGAPGKWDGYGSATPFDGFTYPHGGTWYTALVLHTENGDRQVWAWQQANKPDTLLVFVFSDLNMNADAQGLHYGQHDLEFYTVDTAVWRSKTNT